MGLVFNNKIWQLVERLYIHCYSVDEFINFLKSKEVDIKNNFYSNFDVYVFMSTETTDFARFMQNIPSYRYLSILEAIVFDDKIIATASDNWNYYGKYIKNWYPELIKELKNSNIIIDEQNKKLKSEDGEFLASSDSLDFLQYGFNDSFLDYIKKEINESFNSAHYLSVIILSRKLAECIIIRVFEVVFRKNNENGGYCESNHDLWFDKTKNRYQNFDTLLANLKDNSPSFQEDKELVEEICYLIKPFKDEANKIVHYDYKKPNEDYVKQRSIPDIFDKLGKLYKKYCNP
ncbi:MAG: hypothetical protein GF329_05705 [Candidatus Lokiarchaeota archaeon]|nr:hypothetical protein [Candidatus Lokiarchaeota archaeon]